MKAKFPFLSELTAVFMLLVLPFVVHAQEMPHDPPSDISPDVSRLVADVRHATAGFRDFDSVEDAGYGKFLDCFVNNEVGGMGQHYVNRDLLGDDVLDPM
jgi:hypothetical protein